MNASTDDEILFLVAQVMTSGIKQEGARFTLPESMIIDLVQRARAMEREAIAKEWDGRLYGDTEDIDIGAAIRERGKV